MASEFRKLQSPMQQRKQHSQISGLLVASMSNNQISDDQDDVTGRDVNIYHMQWYKIDNHLKQGFLLFLYNMFQERSANIFRQPSKQNGNHLPYFSILTKTIQLMEEYRYKLSNSRNVSTGLDTKQKVAGELSKIEVKICFLVCS